MTKKFKNSLVQYWKTQDEAKKLESKIANLLLQFDIKDFEMQIEDKKVKIRFCCKKCNNQMGWHFAKDDVTNCNNASFVPICFDCESHKLFT